MSPAMRVTNHQCPVVVSRLVEQIRDQAAENPPSCPPRLVQSGSDHQFDLMRAFPYLRIQKKT